VENSEVAKKREALEALGVSKGIYRAEHKKLKAEADAQVEPLWQHRDRFFLATYAHATRASLAPIFSVAGSCAMGPGGGPGGTATFQQPSTESRSARHLSTGERDPTTIARWQNSHSTCASLTFWLKP